jgi:cysteine desulfurase
MASDGPSCIYLDYNATTPLRPEVALLMADLMAEFGNPSSSHAYGSRPREALECARMHVSSAIGASPEDIFFVSCGTEADQWALWTSVVSWRKANDETPHVVTSEIEHPAVLKNLEMLCDLGMCTHDRVPVDEEGIVSMEQLESAIQTNTCLVTIMHSNNEVGTIQDFEKIRRVVVSLNESRPPSRTIGLHSDLAQSIGRHPIDVNDLGVDYATIVGHKMGAPKGIAALYVSKARRPSLVPLIHGGGQERGMRSGTENVMLCAALGEAIRVSTADLESSVQRMRDMGVHFRRELLERIRDKAPTTRYAFNGCVDSMLPNMVSVSFPGVDASQVIRSVGGRLAISSGSACHKGGRGGVLEAMGKGAEESRGAFRISWGHLTTFDELTDAAEILASAVSSARYSSRGTHNT